MEGPQELGRYKLIRRLAVGGMAEVFLAQAAGPAGFEKTLVVKRILPHFAEDPAFVEMFLNEARLAAKLNHPNIVQIFDLGEFEGSYFLAMEHIDGVTLRVVVRRAADAGQPIPVAAAAKIVSLACDGLAYAHQLADPGTGQPLQLVHRDVSPDNILISFQGAVKVVDFGIARAANQSRVTGTGTLKGKVPYMSPEQIRAKELDGRADLFSLGVVLYELLSGHRPFEAPSEVAMIQAILSEPPVPLERHRQDVPQGVLDILQRALTKERDERYSSCRDLLADLEQAVASIGQPVGSREISALASGSALAPPQPGAGETRATTPMFRRFTPAGGTPAGETPAAAPRFIATLEGSAEDLLVRLTAHYGPLEVVVQPDPPEWGMVSEGGKQVLVRRAPAAERKAIAAAERLGLRYRPFLGRLNASGETAIDLWARTKDLFPADWEVVVPTRPRASVGPPVETSVRVGLSGDAFEVEVTVCSGTAPVDLAVARASFSAGKRFVRLAEGQYAPVGPGVERVERVLGQLEQRPGTFRLPLFELSAVEELLASAATSQLAGEVEPLLGLLRMTGTEPGRPVEPPAEFRGVLRPYQRTGLRWLELLSRYGLAGVLADDAGLGKKVQVLASLLRASAEAPLPHLVVAPESELSRWEAEARRFAPSLETVRLDGRPIAAADHRLLLVNYADLRRDSPALRSLGLSYAVFDDAHRLRSLEPAKLQVLSELRAKHRLALTASPVESRPGELWAIFNLLIPGFLGGAEQFRDRFEQPIERDGDDQAREQLRRRVQPFVLRRLRREVAQQLPRSSPT